VPLKILENTEKSIFVCASSLRRDCCQTAQKHHKLMNFFAQTTLKWYGRKKIDRFFDIVYYYIIYYTISFIPIVSESLGCCFVDSSGFDDDFVASAMVLRVGGGLGWRTHKNAFSPFLMRFLNRLNYRYRLLREVLLYVFLSFWEALRCCV